MPSSGSHIPDGITRLARGDPPTPCFALDLVAFAERLDAVMACGQRHGANYAYPLKANDHPEILRVLAERGVPLDLCSVEELGVALAAGFQPSALTMCGVGLDATEIEACRGTGVRLDLDSLDELRLFAEAPGEVGLRLTIPPVAARGGAAPSYAQKFGLDVHDLSDVLQLIGAGRMKLRRLHVHGVFPAEERERDLVRLMAPWCAAAAGIEEINFGGGFGDGLDPRWAGRTEAHLAACRRIADHLAVGRVVFEPGEAVVAPAGWLLTRVRAVKERGDRYEVVLDAPYTVMVGAGVVSSAYPVRLCPSPPARQEVRCRLFGRNNTPLDVIRQEVLLPRPTVGDLLAIGGQGAYVGALICRFNGRPCPPWKTA